MKIFVWRVLIFLLLVSCADKRSKSAQELLTEYQTRVKEGELDIGFLNDILESREKMKNENDSLGIALIDSILLDSKTGPEFMETEVGSLSIEMGCATVDRAPSKALRLRNNSFKLPLDDIEIPVAYHIVQDDKGNGYIDMKTILEQHDVLNKSFSSTFLSFRLESIDSIRNSKYYLETDQFNRFERKLHRDLGKDQETHLNVYFLNNVGYLGYARFPWADRKNFDGVVILNSTVPGGGRKNHDLGLTLVHEVGHYLGLWHTYHNGCGIGDEVDDTPAQRFRTRGCPDRGSEDSCPGPGRDLVENYMDGSYDKCLKSFTRGQEDRMNWAIRVHRKGFLYNQ